MVSFEAKPFKSGGSHVIVLPKDYVKNGLIDVSKKLLFDVKEE